MEPCHVEVSSPYKDDTRIILCPYQIRAWTVPAGFVWDGASIPRVAWSLIGTPFTGRYQRAALLHDLLYHLRGVCPPHAGPSVHSREAVDLLMYNIAQEDGVGWWPRYPMHAAVRAGGWAAWATDDGPLTVPIPKTH